MRIHRLCTSIAALVALTFWLCPKSSHAEYPLLPKSRTEMLDLFAPATSNTSEQTQTVEVGSVKFENSAWMQLWFRDAYLGQASRVILRSRLDGGTQHHTAQTLTEWSNMSVMFNGDAVDISLEIAPGDTGIFVELDRALVGEFEEGDDFAALKSLCAGDSRVASTDARVGRIAGCTGWLASNGVFLCAGHCCDIDPDRSGPQLPDGVRDLFGTISFNVPLSLTNGTQVAAAPEDQYPILTNYIAWQFPGDGDGNIGDDWCLFACGANTQTGLLAWQAQNSFFRLTRSIPDAGNTIRITGCGVDSTPAGTGGAGNSRNRTLQTATGSYAGESNSGGRWWHSYNTDTEGANSGSPIIWEANGMSIGIHTNAGCQSDGTGNNSGTSFELDALETFLHSFPGANVEYVDNGRPDVIAFPSGAFFFPWSNVANAEAAVASGGVISVVRGTYAETMTFNTPATVQAPVGLVTIGLGATPSLSQPIPDVDASKSGINKSKDPDPPLRPAPSTDEAP